MADEKPLGPAPLGVLQGTGRNYPKSRLTDQVKRGNIDRWALGDSPVSSVRESVIDQSRTGSRASGPMTVQEARREAGAREISRRARAIKSTRTNGARLISR